MIKNIKQKLQEGFTLVEILIVVVIIGILASIAVPIYFDYVKRGYATDATTQIKSIYEASKLYRSENGDYPVDIADIADNNYFNIPRSTLDKWDFEINITDDDSGQMEGTIIATSLDEMPGGAGQFIEFDVSSGRYTGYGQKK